MSDAAGSAVPDLPSSGRDKGFLAAYGVWIAAAIILVALPRIFGSGLALTTMSLMGMTIIFALSYNMLLGQTGLLSFGHAVYFGLGGFLTAHMMNLVESNGVPLPLAVFPVVGGVTGLVFGVIFGAVSTRRAGTAFAMITLGIGELVSSSCPDTAALLRRRGGHHHRPHDLVHLFGITFGPQIQVYYLIAAWCFVSRGGDVRADPHAASAASAMPCATTPSASHFIGYNTQTVRLLAFSLSGLFAGIAGGLAAINFEIVTARQLGAASRERSADDLYRRRRRSSPARSSAPCW